MVINIHFLFLINNTLLIFIYIQLFYYRNTDETKSATSTPPQLPIPENIPTPSRKESRTSEDKHSATGVSPSGALVTYTNVYFKVFL